MQFKRKIKQKENEFSHKNTTDYTSEYTLFNRRTKIVIIIFK